MWICCNSSIQFNNKIFSPHFGMSRVWYEKERKSINLTRMKEILGMKFMSGRIIRWFMDSMIRAMENFLTILSKAVKVVLDVNQVTAKGNPWINYEVLRWKINAENFGSIKKEEQKINPELKRSHVLRYQRALTEWWKKLNPDVIGLWCCGSKWDV